MAKFDKRAFKDKLVQAGRGALKRAFGSDGVHSQYAAEAISEMIAFAAEWLTKSLINQGDTLNANPSFDLFSRGFNLPPDGWIEDAANTKPFARAIEVLHPGGVGQSTLKFTQDAEASTFKLVHAQRIPVESLAPYVFAWDAKATAPGTAGVVQVGYDGYGADPDTGEPIYVSSDSFNDKPAINPGAPTSAFKRKEWVIEPPVGIDAIQPWVTLVPGGDAESIELDNFVLRRKPYQFRYVQDDPGGAQLLEKLTIVKLTFNLKEINYGTAWDDVNHQFVAPYPMVLRIGASCGIEKGPSRIRIWAYKNGAAYALLDDSNNVSSQASRAMGGMADVVCDTGDIVDIRVWHNSGQDEETVPGSANQQVYVTGMETNFNGP